jgi:hypothetical protein
LQATSAALQGSRRQGGTPFASLNTAFATRTSPSSHRAGRVCARRDREVGTFRINLMKFRAAQAVAPQRGYQ